MGKLPIEFKAKWVEALRSGKYKQGDGYLHNMTTDRFCCLGVLCAITGAESTDPHVIRGVSNSIIPRFLQGGSNGSPVVSDLTGMNDGGHSFYEIADYIEANL